MTDEQRELAEYVARWAGYPASDGCDAKRPLVDSQGSPTRMVEYRALHTFLTDDALVMRMLLEIVRSGEDVLLSGGSGGTAGVDLMRWTDGVWDTTGHGWACGTPNEAIFRAHRAVMEGR